MSASALKVSPWDNIALAFSKRLLLQPRVQVSGVKCFLALLLSSMPDNVIKCCMPIQSIKLKLPLTMVNSFPHSHSLLVFKTWYP